MYVQNSSHPIFLVFCVLILKPNKAPQKLPPFKKKEQLKRVFLQSLFQSKADTPSQLTPNLCPFMKSLKEGRQKVFLMHPLCQPPFWPLAADPFLIFLNAASIFFQAEDEKKGAKITQGSKILRRGTSNRSSGSFRRRSIRLNKADRKGTASKPPKDPDSECKLKILKRQLFCEKSPISPPPSSLFDSTFT